jgi:hypothetical protein
MEAGPHWPSSSNEPLEVRTAGNPQTALHHRRSSPYSWSASTVPLLTRKTCPSGCRTCISRTRHGMSVGGKVTSSPAATHCRWTSSTSSTQTDIHTPLSASSSPSGPNVEAFAPLPRPPWPPRQRKISASPDPTAPKLGGVPQSHSFFQPHLSNQAKLAAMSDTFNIGVTCLAPMREV